MGNAIFWYTPIGADRAVRVDLGRPLVERDGPHIRYMKSIATSYGGMRTVRIYSGYEYLSLKLAWQRNSTDGTGTGDELLRNLRGLVAHLKRGGSCSFAEDETHFVAAFVTRRPFGRTGFLDLGPKITNTLAASVSFLNREVFVRTDSDKLLIENRLVDSITGARVTFDRDIVEDYGTSRWILVREAGSYPFLRLPEDALDRDFLSSVEDRVWRLDIPLEDDIAAYETAAVWEGQIQGEVVAPGGDAPGIDSSPYESPFSNVPWSGYRW